MIERQVVDDAGFRAENYIVNTIEEALDTLLPRIRRQSKEFYAKEIRRELEEDGETVVDKHAGNGVYLRATLRNRSY